MVALSGGIGRNYIFSIAWMSYNKCASSHQNKISLLKKKLNRKLYTLGYITDKYFHNKY